MTRRVRLVVFLSLLAAGCEIGERPASYVLPGPTVPSPLPVGSPYVWDTREELAIWVNNPVARGSFTLEGLGSDAFIRIDIDRVFLEWVLRGPDLVPAATGIRTLLIRYRWHPDPDLAPDAVHSAAVTMTFETTTPVDSSDPTAQAAVGANLAPRNEWTAATFIPQGPFTRPADVEYCYIHSFAAIRGVLEIDRIELVQ